MGLKLTDVHTGQSWVVDTTPDPLLRDDCWTTADGRVLALTEMEHTHLERTINFLRLRARRFHKRAIQQMMDDLSGPFAPGGDVAVDAFDREFDALCAAEPREWIDEAPIIRAMKAELVVRDEPWAAA